MITHRTPDGWEIIYQRAHALLAARLVTYWREPERPLRWIETLNAVSQHDNGWQEWEPGDRLTPEGEPRSFMQKGVAESITQAERTVTRAWHQSLWVGLLVSSHVSWLYERKRGRDAGLDRLLDAQIAQRARWRAALGVSEDEVAAGYALLRWGDTFSLILCGRQAPGPGERKALAEGPDGTAYAAVGREGGVLTVEPWPYVRESFEVAVDTHHLPRHTFADEDDLAAVMREAVASQRVWRLER